MHNLRYATVPMLGPDDSLTLGWLDRTGSKAQKNQHKAIRSVNGSVAKAVPGTETVFASVAKAMDEDSPSIGS